MRHTWKAERVRIDGDMIDRSRCVRCAMVSTWPRARDECQGADTLDEARVAKVLAQAKGLEADAEGTRVAREDRLRALGFEEPTAEQRKENLALNVALREWPKD